MMKHDAKILEIGHFSSFRSNDPSNHSSKAVNIDTMN